MKENVKECNSCNQKCVTKQKAECIGNPSSLKSVTRMGLLQIT